jgi:hypothetical protein
MKNTGRAIMSTLYLERICEVASTATFHTFQMLDAGMRQQAALGANHPDGHLALVAATRYMVAQRLRRNVLFSTQNALKVQRGEALSEDAFPQT